ncbi:MAG TPA: hypothetical protein PKC72_07165 [Chitinophagaceae bacterium]|nr:hypothetical protein [Chitinophagaceae bacterium]
MNYIKHLTGFFDLVIKDDRLNPTHISLYVALFQYWNVNRFKNPISISRSEIMKISKISAKGTYHKCMKQLHDYGYIRYDPSYNPFRGSLVHLVPFEEGISRPTRRQLMNQKRSGGEQALTPSLNNPNISNIEKESDLPRSSGRSAPPLSEIEMFFKEKNYPAAEAVKFFNHYKAIGWKIQGITPIEDWKALVEKWMQNAKKWEAPSQNNEDTATESKDIHSLYQSFLREEKVFKYITPEHFEQLKLELTNEILQQAWNRRIDQVSGTNQHSLIQLWQAYLTGNPDDVLLLKDKPNLTNLAKRIAVINHFHLQKQSGKDTLTI